MEEIVGLFKCSVVHNNRIISYTHWKPPYNQFYFMSNIFIDKIVHMTMIGFDPRHGLEIIMLNFPLIRVHMCYARMKTNVRLEEGIISLFRTITLICGTFNIP